MKRRIGGFVMLEVLVTIVIVGFGLLALTKLTALSSQFEMESYQRTQAVILAEDMAERLATNRTAAACYAQSLLGTGQSATSFSCSASTCAADVCDASHQALAAADVLAWHEVLLGSAAGDGSAPMIGARGCITPLNVTDRVYLVSVSWQGIGASAALPDEVVTTAGNVDACGVGQYKNPDGVVSESWRRTVSVPVRIPVTCNSGIGNCNLELS